MSDEDKVEGVEPEATGQAPEKTPEELIAELQAKLDRKEREVKAANAEAAARRVEAKRLKELEEKEKERQDAALSEEERRKREYAANAARVREVEEELAKARKRYEDARIDNAIESYGRGKVRNPEFLPRLVDRPAIHFVGDGDSERVEGVEDEVKRFLKKYPKEAAEETSQGTPYRGGNGYQRPTSGATTTAPRQDDQAALMDEIARKWGAVSKM